MRKGISLTVCNISTNKAYVQRFKCKEDLDLEIDMLSDVYNIVRRGHIYDNFYFVIVEDMK